MEEVDTELWELLYHQLYLSGIIQNVFSEFWMCVCGGRFGISNIYIWYSSIFLGLGSYP